MLTEKPKILAIDDDKIWLEQVPIILEDHGEITTAESIDQGLAAIRSHFFDVILLDLNFDGDSRTGIDVFRKIQSVDSAADVIVISGETRPEKLIEILNAGITHFLTKPASPASVRDAVTTVITRRESRLRAINQAVKPSHGSKMVELIGSSRLMQNLRADIQEAVESGAKDILLLGETGTGKHV